MSRIHIEEVDKDPGIAKFIFRRVGPGGMEHNYLCAVCRDSLAVIETWHGILQPCWDCQKKYKLIKKSWFDKLLKR